MKKIIVAAAAALMAVTTFMGCQMESDAVVATPVTWSVAYELPSDITDALCEGKIVELEVMTNSSSNFKFVSKWWTAIDCAYNSTGTAYYTAGDDAWNMQDSSKNLVSKIYLKASSDMIAAKSQGNFLLAGNAYNVKPSTIKVSDASFPATLDVTKDLQDQVTALTADVAKLTAKTIITWTSAWGGPSWNIDSTWKELNIKFNKVVPTNVQFKIVASDGKDFYVPVNSVDFTVDFAEQLKKVTTKDATLSTIQLQATAVTEAYVNDVVVTKSDESTESLTIASTDDWSYTAKAN